MAIRTFGPNAVDWEQRVDLDGLRSGASSRLWPCTAQSLCSSARPGTPRRWHRARGVERWLKHDPLDVLQERLAPLGVSQKGIEEREAQQIEQAVAAAKAAPDADLAQALANVWSDGSAAWRT